MESYPCFWYEFLSLRVLSEIFIESLMKMCKIYSSEHMLIIILGNFSPGQRLLLHSRLTGSNSFIQ